MLKNNGLYELFEVENTHKNEYYMIMFNNDVINREYRYEGVKRRLQAGSTGEGGLDNLLVGSASVW